MTAPGTPVQRQEGDAEIASTEGGSDSVLRRGFLGAVFKKPKPKAAKRSRVAAAAYATQPQQQVDDGAVSDDTSAAVHALDVLGSRTPQPISVGVHRMARIAKLHAAAPEDVQHTDLPLRTNDRDKPLEFDIYRGLLTARTCGPLKKISSCYQDGLCYDLGIDLPKSIVLRGLETAVQAFERKTVMTKAAQQQQKADKKKKSDAQEEATLEQMLEREHRHIIGTIARIAPPAIVKGMYFGRGMKGKASDHEEMERAYAQVMTAAKLTIVAESEGRDPFARVLGGTGGCMSVAPHNVLQLRTQTVPLNTLASSWAASHTLASGATRCAQNIASLRSSPHAAWAMRWNLRCSRAHLSPSRVFCAPSSGCSTTAATAWIASRGAGASTMMSSTLASFGS